MKRILLLLLCTFICVVGHGQSSAWQTIDYQRLNHKNYQQEPSFNERIDLKKPDYRRLNALLFFMVNEQRSRLGLSILAHHETLEIAAFRHSESMIVKNFFSHKNPKEADRRTSEHRARLAGVANPYIAENIAYFSNSNTQTYKSVAMKLMGQWMASPGHKANILSKEGLQLGCGVFHKDGSW